MQTHRHIDIRQTHRQTDTQTHRHTSTQAHRQTNRQTDRPIDRHTVDQAIEGWDSMSSFGRRGTRKKKTIRSSLMSIIKKKKKIRKIKIFEGNGKTAGIIHWVDPCQKREKWKKENPENFQKIYFSKLLGEQCFSKFPNFHRSPDAVRGACPMNTVVNLQTAFGKSQVWKLAVQTKFTHSRMENQVKQQKHVSSNRASRWWLPYHRQFPQQKFRQFRKPLKRWSIWAPAAIQ